MLVDKGFPYLHNIEIQQCGRLENEALEFLFRTPKLREITDKTLRVRQ